MKLTVNSSDLKIATSEVKGGMSTAKLNPIYETVFLKAQGDKFQILTQDDCIKVVSTIGANVAEEGTFRCNGSLFCGVVAQLLGEKEVELFVNKDTLVFSQGGAKVKVKEIGGYNPPTEENWVDAVQFNASSTALSEGLTRCLVCVSKENTKPLLKGINFALSGDKLRLASLDGYKVARYYVPCKEVSDQYMSTTIYAKCVQPIQSLCAKGDSVTILSRPNKIRFETESGYVESAVINGDFFKVDDFFGQVNARSTAIFNAKDLRQAISLACVSVDDKMYKLDLNFDFDQEKLTIQTQKEGAESSVEVPFKKVVGENVEISVNSNYLLDAIKSIKDEEISFVLQQSLKPMVVSSVDSENSFGLLPIRRV